MIDRTFYLTDAVTLAKSLLGCVLTHDTPQGKISGIIVETEAYMGIPDAASHAHRGRRTKRTETMYAEGGCAYVYLIYGMYNCFNVVANRAGIPEAVLIRALEPLRGLELMQKSKTNPGSLNKLCNGPGKLCRALGISTEQNGMDLCGRVLYVEPHIQVSDSEIISTTRINIDYAGEARYYPYRFYIKGSKCVSRP